MAWLKNKFGIRMCKTNYLFSFPSPAAFTKSKQYIITSGIIKLQKETYV